MTSVRLMKRPAPPLMPAMPVAAAVALSVAAAWPLPSLAAGPSQGPAKAARDAATQELLQELRALKDRVADLEKKLQSQEARTSAASADAAAAKEVAAAVQPGATSGMTPEQQQDFNRIAVKTEAMEDARDMLGFKGLKVSGYMDPTYILNQRRHQGGFVFLNSVEQRGYFYDGSYIGTAVIDFTKETDSGSRWRLTLAPQRGTQGVAEGSSSPVHEASVSVPLSDLQTRFIAGHLPDWSGYEYLQATQNKLITHNLLFDTTLPASYTGAGLELTRGKWIVKGLLANMNASRRNDREKTPVLAYRVDYAKGEFQGFGFAGVHGKAANLSQNVVDANGDVVAQRDSRVDLFEFDAYFIRGNWTVQGQLALGRQKAASITPDPDSGALRDAHWTGLSGLAAYKFEPWLEGIVRLDYLFNKKNGGGLLTYASFDDHNGIGPAASGFDDSGNVVFGQPGRGVNRGALTLGLNYAYNLSTVFKLEYRHDWATGAVFLDSASNTFKKNNHLLGTSVVVSF